MNTNSYKTRSARKEDISRDWYLVDAEGQTLGRMCTQIAMILRGKNKACFTPHVDCGDYVIVINAEKVKLSGQKIDQKKYLTYSGYPGGQKSKTAKQVLRQKPEKIVEHAVIGMLPKTKLGSATFKKLFVYTGPDHKHDAQKPKTIKF